MLEKEKTVLTDRKDFEKVLAENKTDFIKQTDGYIKQYVRYNSNTTSASVRKVKDIIRLLAIAQL